MNYKLIMNLGDFWRQKALSTFQILPHTVFENRNSQLSVTDTNKVPTGQNVKDFKDYENVSFPVPFMFFF